MAFVCPDGCKTGEFDEGKEGFAGWREGRVWMIRMGSVGGSVGFWGMKEGGKGLSVDGMKEEKGFIDEGKDW